MTQLEFPDIILNYPVDKDNSPKLEMIAATFRCAGCGRTSTIYWIKKINTQGLVCSKCDGTLKDYIIDTEPKRKGYLQLGFPWDQRNIIPFEVTPEMIKFHSKLPLVEQAKQTAVEIAKDTWWDSFAKYFAKK